MMLFAWSSERHVDFTAVQAPLAEDSAPAAKHGLRSDRNYYMPANLADA